MPMVELRGLSALEAWSRKVTAGYKDVKVHDLSTSWRDGLAFCALIHHFRPDLIDFDSLSKENILYNNRLAFAIAEKHLGVPSLLDAEDMFKHEEPDRLSVATYLSQFYECFEGSKSDRKPSISGTNSRKMGTNDETHTNINTNHKRNSLTHPPIPPKRDMRCHECKLRVYVLERIIIDDKVYHKSCYDSLISEEITNGNDPQNDNNLNNVLSNTNNNNNKVNGSQQLTVDINDIQLETSDCVVHNDLGLDKCEKNTGYQISDSKTDQINDKTEELVSNKLIVETRNNEDVVEVNEEVINNFKPIDETHDKNVIKVNEEIIINESIDKSLDKNSDLEEKCENSINEENNIDIKDETNDKLLDNKSINENSSVDGVTQSLKNVKIDDKSKDQYPNDKNPFGDEEEEEINEKVVKTYPTDMNPFGDEEEEEEIDNSVRIRISKSSSSLNPFGEEFDENDYNCESSTNNTPKPKPRKSLNVSDVISPTSSLRTRKKRVAPTPPMGLSQVNSSCSLISNVAISGDSSRRDSLISNVSSDLPSSVPTSRTPTPLPRLRLQKSADDLSDISADQRSSDKKTENNINNNSVSDNKTDTSINLNESHSELKKTENTINNNNNNNSKTDSSIKQNKSDSDIKNTFGYWKAKKRPAPPIPAVKRTIKGSVAEIEAELNSIGDQLPIIEKKGNELEMIIKNRETGYCVEEKDEIMDQFLATAREKCRLARRQKELMYMKREHKLEEIQADIEYQMRTIMSKQSAQKTKEDEEKEDELLKRLVEIIEERNDIVENMIRDENKEVEEYQKLVSKVMPTKTTTDSKPGIRQTKSNEALDKVKDKDNKHKDKKKSKKEKSEKVEKTPKFGELKKEAKNSFTLGKTTLKKLGIKSSSDNKLDKNEKKSENNSSNSVLSNKTDK